MTTLSRRHLVTTAAALPALAVPAMSLPAIAGANPIFAATVASDPIFEKVVKYKAAWDSLKAHPDEPTDADGRLDS